MSRVRSAYQIERDALAQAAARHAAVVARVQRAKVVYRAQKLDVAREVPATKSIAGMNSSQASTEIARLESALARCERAASAELDDRCRAAYHEAFEAAKAQIESVARGPVLGDRRLERRERSTDRQEPTGGELASAITGARASIDRILGRLAAGAPATSRAQVMELADMVASSTSTGQVERVVGAVRVAVSEANKAAEATVERSRRIDGWIERLHHLEAPDARVIEERVRRLDPGSPWPGGIAEAIEREIEEAERDDARDRALTAVRDALTSLGYSVSDGFNDEAFVGSGSLASIPDRPDHRVRVRERRGTLLMDVVRVQGGPDRNVDRVVEQGLCNAAPGLAAEAGRNGVVLLVESPDATGELDVVELELPGRSPSAATEGRDKPLDRSRKRPGVTGRERDRRR